MLFSKTLRHYLAYILPQKKEDIPISVCVSLMFMSVCLLDNRDEHVYPPDPSQFYDNTVAIDTAQIRYSKPPGGKGTKTIRILEKRTNKLYSSTDLGTGNKLLRLLSLSFDGQTINPKKDTSIIYLPLTYYSSGEIYGVIYKIIVDGRTIYQASDDYIRSQIRSHKLTGTITRMFFLFLCVYMYALVFQIIFLFNKRS